MPEMYTYAVARLHASENNMLSNQDLERLLSSNNVHEALAILAEKGYDTMSTENADAVLEIERKKLWNLISELVDDISVFDIFLYENDFHNLKAAVKSVVTKDYCGSIFVSSGTVSAETVLKAVKEREFGELPEFLRETAEKAVKALLETGDGGLCDVIIDKAYLEMLLECGKKSDIDLIKNYAETTVALANIKIAARGSRTGKSAEFFRRSLAGCKTLDVESLGGCAAKGFEELLEYLKGTDYLEAASVLAKSYTAFEKWCDDRIMREAKKEKNNQFTIAPIFAHILAKESEFKMVGLVLTAKQNKLSEDAIRERLRELYV
ncbi:MAG: V-type ATPase subunit [Clostridia bacterium]|nr:V-type ATPase subunit [Clostridia bacterium]